MTSFDVGLAAFLCAGALWAGLRRWSGGCQDGYDVGFDDGFDVGFDDGFEAASCDTHPKGGDVKQAPAPLSGAVPEGQTPKTSHSSEGGRGEQSSR
jgi:hypothetical protein